MKKHLFLVFFLFFLHGCGGGGASSSSNSNPEPNNIDVTPLVPVATYGYLSDSLINGIEYRCGDIIGITGENGQDGSFQYKSDCNVEFYIGKIHLGDINGSILTPEVTLYPANILDTTLRTSDVNNTKVVNFARLIQSLDSDNNVSNGITIDENTRNNLSAIIVNELDLTENNVTEYDLNSTLRKAYPDVNASRSLKELDVAVAHLTETLTNSKYDVNSTQPAKPYILNPISLREMNITQITSSHITEKTFLIHGEPGNTIWIAYENNNSITPLDADYTSTNLKMTNNWTQNITLSFDDANTTSFNYFIKLKDSAGNFSTPYKLSINKDTTPPHVQNANIIEEVVEEQPLFRNINATDAGGINGYRIVSQAEDDRSEHDDSFTIDTNGTVTFINLPNFDINSTAIYKVVTRVVDFAGNMTDLLLQVKLKNLLDNPPALTDTHFPAYLLEVPSIGDFVFDLNTTLQDVTIAPDNNPTLSPIYYHLNNHTDLFDINESTGRITIKENNSTLFDYEQSPNTIDLNISVENNNTKPTSTGDLNITYATLTVNIINKIDTTPVIIATMPYMEVHEHNNTSGGPYPIGGILIDPNNGDTNKTMIFSITNGNDGNFTIDSNTGIISAIAGNHLDYETTPEYNLTIKATNSWWDGNTTANFTSVNQTIKLHDDVDNPPIIVLKTLTNSIPESNVSDSLIATFDVNGTIADSNITTSYGIDSVYKNGTLLTAGAHPFTINTTTGTVTTSRQLLNDYNETISNTTDTVFTIHVKAQNLWWTGIYNYSNEITFDVNVTNVIDNAPVLATLSTITVDENVSTGPLYNIDTNGTIYDANNVTTFSIVSGNSESKFDINATTGVITLTNSLDWETTTSYSLGIKASNIDWNGTTLSSPTSYLTIEVNNIIETPPSITAPTFLNIHENIDIGEVIASIEINSTEEDKKTVDSFSIVSGNSTNKFALSSIKIDTVTGLKYVDLSIANALDYETNSSYILEVNATNIKGSTTQTIHINVLDDTEKDLPLLITMIEYNDINITTSTSDVYNKIFSATVPIFGSLNDYFKRVSKTKFLFKKATETDGTSDGIVVVNLNKNHPQTDINRLTDDIKDALINVDSYVNFATYDTNSDGNISKNELQLLFLIAGGERTYGDTNLSITGTTGSLDANLTLDGKNIAFTGSGNYVVVGEKNGINDNSIGLIAHHLGNTALNFPYLSDRTNASYGIGYFGLMGYGYRGALDDSSSIGTTPVNPSAYSILSQGWVFPKVIKRTTLNVEMVASNKGIDGFNIIKIPTNDSKIYYLLENRIKTNLVGYDDGFYRMESTPFNGGLALWKINENSSDNDTVSTKLVDLLEYDGSTDIDTKLSYGTSSGLYHTANPTYPSALSLPFLISNSSIDPATNKITIDISFP